MHSPARHSTAWLLAAALLAACAGPVPPPAAPPPTTAPTAQPATATAAPAATGGTATAPARATAAIVVATVTPAPAVTAPAATLPPSPAATATPIPAPSPAATSTSATQAPTTAAPARPTVTPPRAGSLLTTSRVVTYYGNPLSDQMGILGELSKEQLVARLRQVAADYERAGGRPVKPALHMVATVAQASPGADGLWRARMAPALIQEYADLAKANDMLFIVDVQIGHSTWAAEIEALRPFLSQPHVHLAMDPEFDMDPGEAPGDYIGSSTAADINHAIRYLGGLVDELKLPPKLLIVHQFEAHMLPDKAGIAAGDPRVDVTIMMDGFGSQEAKLTKYNALVRDQPVEHAGIKLFYRQDLPVMSPAQIVGLEPSPAVITYQ